MVYVYLRNFNEVGCGYSIGKKYNVIYDLINNSIRCIIVEHYDRS